MTALFVPATEETDQKKQNMSLQLIGGILTTAVTNIATNTTNIATNTASIAQHESAWVSYTPTVTVTGGTGTATGYYKLIGKTLHVKATITVATGPGTTLSWTIPSGTFANGSAYVMGREQAVNGKMWSGRCDAASGTVTCQQYDNNAATAAGFVIVFTGVAEIA